MNDILMMPRLRELLVIFMHTRSLRDKSADALRYCSENLPAHSVSVGVYGEYQEIIEQLNYLADEQNRIAPDDLLSYGGEMMLSILLLYEKLAANIAIDDFMQQSNGFQS
ncbi:hypothetical protein [Superficieibacter sp.]|uniref:hypothetical protein n=1 Tax=Superficieibacter sp. TaxID=2303322 RepID=UPI0028B17B9B|nr:hypothetical protein [Superficieibacter sp.]